MNGRTDGRHISVEGAPAIRSTTKARNLLIFNGELVVIGDLLPHFNVPLGVDDYLLLRAKVDDLGIAVWLREREGGREREREGERGIERGREREGERGREREGAKAVSILRCCYPLKWAHITAVVDEASKVSIVSGVNDIVMVHTEEIAAADASCLVASFPLVCHMLSNDLPHVLNDHLIGRNGLHCKQAPVVDGGLRELELLLAGLGEE